MQAIGPLLVAAAFVAVGASKIRRGSRELENRVVKRIKNNDDVEDKPEYIGKRVLVASLSEKPIGDLVVVPDTDFNVLAIGRKLSGQDLILLNDVLQNHPFNTVVLNRKPSIFTVGIEMYEYTPKDIISKFDKTIEKVEKLKDMNAMIKQLNIDEYITLKFIMVLFPFEDCVLISNDYEKYSKNVEIKSEKSKLTLVKLHITKLKLKLWFDIVRYSKLGLNRDHEWISNVLKNVTIEALQDTPFICVRFERNAK